jgi:hypothetical protein
MISEFRLTGMGAGFAIICKKQFNKKRLNIIS